MDKLVNLLFEEVLDEILTFLTSSKIRFKFVYIFNLRLDNELKPV